ncbi:MAG: DUF6526 family protein [Ginsengibacter sp.]
METQNYSNYKKYYIPHHFIFLPLTVFLTTLGIWEAYSNAEHRLEWQMFSILSFCLLYLAVMLRQHYALGNQDRIVRLEFRLRYFELFGESSGQVEEKLSFDQIAAFRFADQDEFKKLLEKALNENFSASQIKKSIKNWKADHMRL